MKKVELLSPVGNMEVLQQAVHNGADAVYLAGQKYGARKFSTNFTAPELIEAINYCHLYGVLVYVTVNTIIYEEEVADFLNYIEFLYNNGVDALIMQDIGLMNLVKKKFNKLDIHASTQCHNHNQEGVEFLKNIGCSRVVLAREMSLSEIKSLPNNIEKEVFVYGALCICYSGCCLFSSLNGGRSGNRGECVGSCRLKYSLLDNQKKILISNKYLLSTKELNTLENLPEILNSNIDSLKIEGRMKSPAYVGYVTKTYRRLIDNYYQNKEVKLTLEELKNLKKLYNRQFTKGYLLGETDIVNTNSSNHLGIKLGKVIKVTKEKIFIKLDEEINQGDGIRFSHQEKGLIVNKLYNKKNLLVNSVSAGSICQIDNKISLTKIDEVLKTTDIKLLTNLSVINKKKIPVSFTVKLFINKPFELEISDGQNQITAIGDIIEEAITQDVSLENIKKCLGKLGNTAFELKEINIKKDQNIFLSLKNLNKLRRELVEKLITARIKISPREVSQSVYPPQNILLDNTLRINVLVRNEEQLICCLHENVSSIYVEDYHLYQKYQNQANIYYRIDRVSNHYPALKHEKLLVGDLGGIYKYNKENELLGDYFLNIANHYSAEFYNSLNLKRVTLSPEINDNTIALIAKQSVNTELIIYGRLELMVMKHCLLKKNLNYCSNCQKNKLFYLKDQSNHLYPLLRNNCLNHLFHYKSIDKISKINYYRTIGITNYRIDLFAESKDEVISLLKRVKDKVYGDIYE